MRSEWCTPVHFVKNPGRVLLPFCLVVDFTLLNDCLIQDQPQVFSTGEEIRQQLASECKVLDCMDAKEDQLKTTFMVHSGRYFFCKTVMGNRLSSHTWLKASNEVIEVLGGVFQLVINLLIWGHDYKLWRRE